jgi:DnaK suppressor protein
MNETKIEQIRQKLLNHRSELQELEESSKEETNPGALNHVGMGNLSRMDTMQAQKVAEEGTRRCKRQILKIDGALRRINLGEYGKCFICEEEIDLRRLSVDPTITRCMNCEEP